MERQVVYGWKRIPFLLILPPKKDTRRLSEEARLNGSRREPSSAEVGVLVVGHDILHENPITLKNRPPTCRLQQCPLWAEYSIKRHKGFFSPSCLPEDEQSSCDEPFFLYLSQDAR
ncbi:hypothetical protein TNCV_2602771 [Trichonephila clavipes]|nr:hypothetical protein TNCV_2602771 [Trichonephila clavipes]